MEFICVFSCFVQSFYHKNTKMRFLWHPNNRKIRLYFVTNILDSKPVLKWGKSSLPIDAI